MTGQEQQPRSAREVMEQGLLTDRASMLRALERIKDLKAKLRDRDEKLIVLGDRLQRAESPADPELMRLVESARAALDAEVAEAASPPDPKPSD